MRNSSNHSVRCWPQYTDWGREPALTFFALSSFPFALDLEKLETSKVSQLVTALFCGITCPSAFHIMSDEEPVDPKKEMEEACKPKCVKTLLEYQSCVKRIQGDETGHKHCTGQYFDYWSCVDKCVAPKLFDKLT